MRKACEELAAAVKYVSCKGLALEVISHILVNNRLMSLKRYSNVLVEIAIEDIKSEHVCVKTRVDSRGLCWNQCSHTLSRS